MSLSSEEEIGAVVYTAMLEQTDPCYASDLCDRVRGLKTKQDIVIKLLKTMCDNEMVVNVRGKYILKENMKPELVENVSSLTYDGPNHGTTCSSTQLSGLAMAGPVNVQAEAMVPVQQSTVQRSTSSYSACNNSEVELYTGKLDKIIDCLKTSSGAMKAKDIAQRTGIGLSRSDVNRYLYFLKKQNAITDNGKSEWIFVKDVTGDDLKMYAAQLAKIPGGKKSTKALPDSSNGRCDCENAGPGCVHVTHNYTQHNHYHQHNTQIGDHNRMRDDSHSDDPASRGSLR